MQRAATRRRSCAPVSSAQRSPPFHYRDKGNLATIGRAAAVADIKGLRLSGFIAWLTWLFVHLWYLIGFQNRLLVAHPLDVQLRHARPRRAADQPAAGA